MAIWRRRLPSRSQELHLKIKRWNEFKCLASRHRGRRLHHFAENMFNIQLEIHCHCDVVPTSARSPLSLNLIFRNGNPLEENSVRYCHWIVHTPSFRIFSSRTEYVFECSRQQNMKIAKKMKKKSTASWELRTAGTMNGRWPTIPLNIGWPLKFHMFTTVFRVHRCLEWFTEPNWIDGVGLKRPSSHGLSGSTAMSIASS